MTPPRSATLALAVLLTAAAPSAPGGGGTGRAEAQAPSPRDHHALARGPDGTLVLFGGSSGAYPDFVLHGDTWVWDADGWRLASREGPPAHSSVSMAYDSARGEVVLFGGWTGDGDLGDTWTWDGAAWARREGRGGGPGPRSSAAMAWDGGSGRVILHGGCGEGVGGETWAWDGAEWARVWDGSTGPGPRCRAVLEPGEGGLVLHGGTAGVGPGASWPVEAWLWRDGEWRHLEGAGAGPGARANHSAVADPRGRGLLVLGGRTASREVPGDLWRLRTGGWERVGQETVGPVPREVAAWAWSPASGGAVLHGGRDAEGRSLGDTWEWDGVQWDRVAVDPGLRASHVMVYHPGLERVVLVGGVAENLDGGVWAWDGEWWHPLDSDRGPGSRGHFGLAYDPVGDRLLLHGGLGLGPPPIGVSRHGDFWAWERDGWIRIHGAERGPGERDHHAMVWDERNGELVLFGGGRGIPGEQVLLGDTWVWTPETGWSQRRVEGPPARATHRLVYDRGRGRVVLFGGWGDDGLLNDTWEWDGDGWHHTDPAVRPSPRFATRMAYDGERGRVVLYGGRGDDGNLGDVWAWDGRRWEPLALGEGPGPRNVHAMAYDPERRRVVVHGGIDVDGRLEDLWELAGDRWIRPGHGTVRDGGAPGGPEEDASPADAASPGEASTPAGRGAAAGAWDPRGRRLLVFGGIGAEPRAFGDFWAWDGRWRRLPTAGGPGARFNATAAWLPSRDHLVLYGGGAIDEQRGDTWVWQDGRWRELDGPGPPTRYCARMVARPDRGDALLYGGVAPDGTAFRETWRWDGSGWSRIATDGPPGACFHAMAYDAARGRLVLFGGRDPEHAGATWVFDGEWHRLDVPGPPPRDHHAMAWDAARGRVVLFGGGGRDADGKWDGTALDDTWLWDGSSWERAEPADGPRRHHAPVLVGAGDRVLLFGGSNEDGSHGDLWAWDGSRWRRLDP